jgi:hypothetical protein
LIQSWIDHPDIPIPAVTNGIGAILPKVLDFLGRLPKPTDGVEPCNSGKRLRRDENDVVKSFDKRDFLGGLFKTAFSLITCIVDTTNKVKDAVIKGSTSVKDLENALKPMISALNEVVPNEETNPSGSNSDKPTSIQLESPSSTCTLQTVSNCNIGCTATATITLGGPNKRAEGDTCTTVCGEPITRCNATGLTSVSTVTSTTTTYQLCSPDCSACNADTRNLPSNAPALGSYSKASNGVFYVPAPTVTALDDDNPSPQKREFIPRRQALPEKIL